MKNFFLPLLLLAANFCVGQVNLNLGLKAYYPFTGNANDVSGNNNNPVFNNATLTADRFGNPNSAYHFNGTNNYMRILNSPTLNMGNTMSISLWVKPTGWYTGQCYNNMMLMKGDGDFLTGNYSLRFADAINGCSATPSTTDERFYDGAGTLAMLPIVQLNQWYSVVITYDGTTARLYVNCILQATNSISPTFTNAYDVFLGHLNNAQFPYWLNGDLDEVRIYDRALNVDEVNTLGGCITQTPCNNWLNTPSFSSYARIGDLDVSGNQITVEATYNRTQPLNGGLYPGHLVSKHTDVSNVNYALFPNGCSITTTNGYKETFENCALDLNKTYHVAMVYDGSFLKFYRNGFLHSKVACTGNMILNNLQATIAQYAGAPGVNEQFLGNVNEVRIWNVARTQAQLQTYMNNSLPNPTTITGLLGYYTFDNLLNKQGNAAYNATLVGPATINATNPNCTFVADSCAYSPCSNWLRTQVVGQSVTVGDLDVSGNQLTIEGNFNCSAYPVGTGNIWEEIVSKHSGTNDCNYALRMNLGAITTTNGFFRTPPFPSASCDSNFLNKTYHAAMVYNGSTLKFYRNGFLMTQIPATGNLVLNNLLTTIGDYAINNPQGTNFQGYLNEIRIWNVARTQSQIQTYMNASIPNPATQTGLLAYYTFDNLVNKQGNATWNGTLNGGATINNTNPNCTFTADSCAVTSTSVIINDYTPVLGFNPCDNKLTVEDGTAYNIGDTVLLIQMKGAVIDSTNTASFGTIIDYKNAGNYEFNYIKSKTGNVIELRNALTRQYDIPFGKVQLIRVPYYTNLTTSDILTCLPWDGSKGGVLVFNVQNSLTLNQDMDVSGKGFTGGIDPVTVPPVFNCNENQFYYPANADLASGKGEGIADISAAKSFGKGALANGGGGGNSHNSGGAGGGNISTGGSGGYQFENSPCNGTVPFDNGGISGKALTYSNAASKIFLGGGGGAGHTNNPESFQAKGGNGAGIIIVSAGSLTTNAKKIIANGSDGIRCGATTSGCHEGMGGGGAAGTVLLKITSYLDNTTIESKGGKGADMTAAGFGKVGPGGGGSGGPIWLTSASLPANVNVVNTGGINGVCTGYSNNAWGATAGSAGQNLFNLILPIDNVAFKTNIDSVRIKDSLLSCNGFDFKGLAYINTNPIASWQWYFGDGGQASTQNTSHAYTLAGLYTVKLIVTDINGCMDSTLKDVNALPGVNAEAGTDTSICTTGIVSVTLHGTATGGPYLWSPAIYLNNPNIQNPVATISSTTKFYLNVTGAASCTSLDSVTIYINPLPLVDTRADTTICRFSPLVLNTNSNAATYQWSPPAYVSNPNVASPNYIDIFSHRVFVTGTSALGCKATDSLDVTVNPLPLVQTIADTTLCQSKTVTLTTTGAQTYSWSPAMGLSNPNASNPVFIGNSEQTYTVTGTDGNGCKNTDIVTISIIMPGFFKAPPLFTMCQKQSTMLDGNNGYQVSYLWSPSTHLSSATIINPVANPPQTTLYTLLVTDNRCGFDSTFTTLLTVVPAPVINARKSNDIDCALRSATLFASGGNQYLWSPATGLNNATIANPVAIPANTQTYTVLVTNATGCTNTDSVTVFIKNAASLARYMPNAFTPDGNGINDCYGLKNWMYIQKLQFYIFNRFGEQVFATANPNTCWDGTYKGKPALAGAYVYVIKAQTDCGLEEQKGNFILIR
jgi:gliding motility-associated-like protein